MNLHYFQHGNDSNDYTFTLPETTTVDEEQLEIDIYEVGFRIGALNNDGTVTYTHSDETTQVNVLEGQDNTDIENMFEDVVYNIYDTLETFIESFTITINDWSLLDDISFKYIQPTTTTTTTTTLPPPPPPDPIPDPEPMIPPEEIKDIPIELDNGEIVEYSQREIDDGTLERDQQRQSNLEIYGVELTDEQLQRDFSQDELREMELVSLEDIEEEFFEDDFISDDMEDEYDDEELIELSKEEIKEIELEKELNETINEVEEFLEDFEEIEIVIIQDIDDLQIDIQDIVVETSDPKEEEIIEIIEEEVLDEDNIEILQDEDTSEEVEEILIEEVVTEEIEELEEKIEEIIVLDIPEVTEEELEDFTEEELEEYEEQKEKAIENFVNDLETEEVIEIIEEINDIGVENFEEISDEVIAVVSEVVEEVIETVQEDITQLSEQEVEVVAEVFGFEETEDVEIVAQAALEDESIAVAVEEYVERAKESSKDSDQPYTLADTVTEIQFEEFIQDPIGAIISTDLTEIDLSNIGADMTSDQKQKAKEVVVPTILVRIASLALLRKTI
tara:strand:- start:98 stop:1780 length:1683 start_codon:yes stop_codon:yes gene_type:complete